MIKLYLNQKDSNFPHQHSMCHHRLAIDYKEICDSNQRMKSNKCLTYFDTPQCHEEYYLMPCEILSNEGFYKNILFQV
jgi:hypothetical protein